MGLADSIPFSEDYSNQCHGCGSTAPVSLLMRSSRFLRFLSETVDRQFTHPGGILASSPGSAKNERHPGFIVPNNHCIPEGCQRVPQAPLGYFSGRRAASFRTLLRPLPGSREVLGFSVLRVSVAELPKPSATGLNASGVSPQTARLTQFVRNHTRYS